MTAIKFPDSSLLVTTNATLFLFVGRRVAAAAYPPLLGVNSCLQICNFYAYRPKLNNHKKIFIKSTY